jgi:hypothetical protein
MGPGNILGIYCKMNQLGKSLAFLKNVFPLGLGDLSKEKIAAPHRLMAGR